MLCSSLDKQRVFIAVLFTLCTLEGEKLRLVQSKNYSVKEGILSKPLETTYLESGSFEAVEVDS